MKYLNGIISDKLDKYYETGDIESTFFMDPSEIVDVIHILKNTAYTVYGGFEEAERKIIMIGSSDKKDFIKFAKIIRITPNNKDTIISHRSVLGSVLGLGVKREMIGDIIINNNVCDIIVINSIFEFLLNNFKYVGREKVSVKEIPINEMIEVEDTSKEIRTTVSSLRVDSIISAGFGIPREKSAELIKNEMVKVNYIMTKSTNKAVKKDDIISVRTKGRLIISEIIGESKSGRIKILLLKK